MAISDAFLKGQTIARSADQQRLGMLQALINRPYPRGGAVRYGGGGGGGRPAVATAADVAEMGAMREERERERERAAELHAAKMEALETEGEIRQQMLSERQQAQDVQEWEQIQRDIEAPMRGEIRRGAMQDVLNQQQQMRSYQAYSDAIYRGDAAAADRHFRGMFPGMGDVGTATVRRQAVDPQTGEPMVDETGAPVMTETRYDTAGQPITEEDFAAQAAKYPRHRSDGGVVYLQFGDETPVPIGPGRLRQFHMAISQAAMAPMAGGRQARTTAAAGTAPATGVASEKERSQIALNRAKIAGSALAGGVAYSDAMPVQVKDPETGKWKDSDDAYAVKSAEQFQRDLVTGMGLIAKMSGDKQRGMGMPTPIKPLGPQASREFARRARTFYDNQRQIGGRIPSIPQMIERARAEHGLGVAHELTKIFKAELTPSDMRFQSEDPSKTPDFGNGTDNVIHLWEPSTGLGIAIDEKVGVPRYYNANSKSWEAMPKSMEDAYYNLLVDRAENKNDKEAQRILNVLNLERPQGFTINDLLDPLGRAAVKTAREVGEWMGEEAERMGQWVPGGRPRQLGGEGVISPTPGR